jgi:type VI secretion system protein ImpJ
MEHIKPVFWYQGLFLQPQHFQQFDRYLQSLLTPYGTYQHPFFWGVCSLEVNRSGLANKVFEINRGEFLFPDQTWAVFPGNASVSPRALTSEYFSQGRPLRIYLGLPAWERSQKNVTIVKTGDYSHKSPTRYMASSEPDEMTDMLQGGHPAQVKLMEYSLSIILEQELDEYAGWSLIPLAELIQNDNVITLSDEFVPPSMTVNSSPALSGLIRGTADQIAFRCHKLEEYKNARGLQSSGVDSSYILFMLALRSLSRSVPLIEHAVHGNSHPWDLYGLFRSVIGELSTYTNRIDCLGRLRDGAELVPQYDHQNLYHCFDSVRTLIGELLSTIMIGPEAIIPLSQDNGLLSAPIPTEMLTGERMYYLTISTAESAVNVISAMERIVKVSSSQHMKTLLMRALPGIGLIRCQTPPPGVPTRPNAFYFEIDQNHAQWPEIKKDRSLCLAWNKAPADLTAELIVLRR